MISYEQAESFLNNVLEMPKDWKEILNTDKLEFLRLYMVHHNTRVPFQNILMAAVDISSRKRPDEREIISQGLSGVGGCCIHLNYFTKIVFIALGLDAFAIKGDHFNAPVPGTHCMVIVKLNVDELYLVEVGGAFPILDPVPMHKLPFRILAAAGFPYEFREISKGLIGRYHIGGGFLGGAYVGKTESLRTSWNLTPRDYSEFDGPMQQVFTNPEGGTLLRNAMMCRYFLPNELSAVFPQINFLSQENSSSSKWSTENYVISSEPLLNFVYIFKKVIVIGNAHSRKVVKTFETFDEMAVDIHKCFPKLKLEEIIKATAAFNKCEVKPSLFDDI